MTTEHLEVLVEEPSMAAALEILLPRLLGSIPFAIRLHQGKSDLLTKLPGRLKGYARFVPGGWRILVVIDRDEHDCRKLKAQLEQMAARAGLRTRSAARRTRDTDSWVVVNRLAVEELEAWYFGDWKAVQSAFPGVPPTLPRKAGFRDPDAIAGGTCEAFERVLQRAGYFRGGLRKVEAARDIGEKMNPSINTSRSFQVFRDVIQELVAA